MDVPACTLGAYIAAAETNLRGHGYDALQSIGVIDRQRQKQGGVSSCLLFTRCNLIAVGALMLEAKLNFKVCGAHREARGLSAFF